MPQPEVSTRTPVPVSVLPNPHDMTQPEQCTGTRMQLPVPRNLTISGKTTHSCYTYTCMGDYIRL